MPAGLIPVFDRIVERRSGIADRMKVAAELIVLIEAPGDVQVLSSGDHVRIGLAQTDDFETAENVAQQLEETRELERDTLRHAYAAASIDSQY